VTDGRTGTALCGSLVRGVGGAGGRGRCGPLARWLGGQSCWAARGKSVGPGAPVMALAVRRLDSAAARDGDAPFAVCFMLVVSCAPRRSRLSMIIYE